MILVACSLLREIAVLSAGTKDTKYEASASTLLKPTILSGPTESYNGRKRILFIYIKFLYFEQIFVVTLFIFLTKLQLNKLP